MFSNKLIIKVIIILFYIQISILNSFASFPKIGLFFQQVGYYNVSGEIEKHEWKELEKNKWEGNLFNFNVLFSDDKSTNANKINFKNKGAFYQENFYRYQVEINFKNPLRGEPLIIIVSSLERPNDLAFNVEHIANKEGEFLEIEVNNFSINDSHPKYMEILFRKQSPLINLTFKYSQAQINNDLNYSNNESFSSTPLTYNNRKSRIRCGLLSFSKIITESLKNIIQDSHEKIEEVFLKKLLTNYKYEINDLRHVVVFEPFSNNFMDRPPISIEPIDENDPQTLLNNLCKIQNIDMIIFGHFEENLSGNTLLIAVRTYSSRKNEFKLFYRKISLSDWDNQHIKRMINSSIDEIVLEMSQNSLIN